MGDDIRGENVLQLHAHYHADYRSSIHMLTVQLTTHGGILTAHKNSRVIMMLGIVLN